VFSPRDISKILGQGAARSTLTQSQIGTLEPGKLADMVLIDGNPLTDVNDLQNVVTTIKAGRIVRQADGACEPAPVDTTRQDGRAWRRGRLAHPS